MDLTKKYFSQLEVDYTQEEPLKLFIDEYTRYKKRAESKGFTIFSTKPFILRNLSGNEIEVTSLSLLNNPDRIDMLSTADKQKFIPRILCIAAELGYVSMVENLMGKYHGYIDEENRLTAILKAAKDSSVKLTTEDGSVINMFEKEQILINGKYILDDDFLKDIQSIYQNLENKCHIWTIAFIFAAKNGHVEILRRLRSKINEAGLSWAFVAAAQSGQEEAVIYCIDNNVNNKITLAFQNAVKNGHVTIVKKILENYKKYITSKVRLKAIRSAVQEGHLSTTKFLIASISGLAIFSEGVRDAFILACKCGQVAIVKVLLSEKYNVIKYELIKETFIDNNISLDIKQELINHEAFQIGDKIHVLEIARKFNMVELIRLLLKQEDVVRVIDNRNEYFFWAIKHADLETVKKLAASLKVTHKDGSSVHLAGLFLAAMINRIEIVNDILSVFMSVFKSDIAKNKLSKQLLILAVKNNAIDVVKELIKRELLFSPSEIDSLIVVAVTLKNELMLDVLLSSMRPSVETLQTMRGVVWMESTTGVGNSKLLKILTDSLARLTPETHKRELDQNEDGIAKKMRVA